VHRNNAVMMMMMIIIIIGKLQNQYEYKTAMANKATEGQI
jgi:hypothetical protein